MLGFRASLNFHCISPCFLFLFSVLQCERLILSLHVCVSKWMWGLTWFSLRGSLWLGRFYIFSPYSHTHAHTHTHTHTHTDTQTCTRTHTHTHTHTHTFSLSSQMKLSFKSTEHPHRCGSHLSLSLSLSLSLFLQHTHTHTHTHTHMCTHTEKHLLKNKHKNPQSLGVRSPLQPRCTVGSCGKRGPCERQSKNSLSKNAGTWCSPTVT